MAWHDALSVSFHWQELVPDPRLHTVTHSAQDFIWRTLPVCILITAKIQFTHRSNFDGIPGRVRSSPGSQTQRGMRQMQEFAIRKALRILTLILSASASPKSFPGDHHTTPRRICPALSPDRSREYSPGSVLALLTSLANSVGLGMNLFFPCLNRYHQSVLLRPQGINKGPKEKTPGIWVVLGFSSLALSPVSSPATFHDATGFFWTPEWCVRACKGFLP